jgi:hypothetical protein
LLQQIHIRHGLEATLDLLALVVQPAKGEFRDHSLYWMIAVGSRLINEAGRSATRTPRGASALVDLQRRAAARALHSEKGQR